ncbi:hypothetical protein ACFL27_15050, partial [candidate division CSSED10-310 bacterium]
AFRCHLEIASFDASLSYLSGYAPFPGIEFVDVEGLPTGEPTVSLRYSAYQHQVIGFDFSTTIGDYCGLRGEAAYRLPDEYEGSEYIPLPDLQYVVGFDREFGGQVSCIAQYISRHVFEWQKVESSQFFEETTTRAAGARDTSDDILELLLNEVTLKNRMISGQLEQISHSASLRVEWKFIQETLSLEAFGIMNFSTEEWMFRPRLTYDITDELTITVGGEIYRGPGDTLFGVIDELMSAGFMELKASF